MSMPFPTDSLQTLYYWCLRRTGSAAEAEELAADIAAAVLTSLARLPAAPENPHAYLWATARRRYARWAEARRRARDTASWQEPGVAEPSDPSPTPAEQAEQADALRALRRELAFAAAEYRTILVAYYLENRRVADIAASAGLPVGTVKRKLHEARHIIKEAMAMNRAFGQRSYRPEDVTFFATGSQPDGLPWKAVSRQIPKNILLHAHNNPSTLDELAVELGIARPYMEEEVALLEDATLLRREGDRFRTAFYIADRETREEVYHLQRRDAAARHALLRELLEAMKPSSDKKKWLRPTARLDENDYRWQIALGLTDLFIRTVKGYTLISGQTRPNGGNWGFFGTEQGWDAPEPLRMGNNSCGNAEAPNRTVFCAYKIGRDNLWDRAGEMGYHQTLLLGDILRHNRPLSSLSDSERRLWQDIDGRFAHAEGDVIVPDIIVIISGTDDEELVPQLAPPSVYEELLAAYQQLFDDTAALLGQRRDPVLQEQRHFAVCMFLYDTRMMAVNDLIAEGWLRVPEQPEQSTMGMYIDVR